MVDNISELLRSFGFSDYEARTYTALVRTSPSTAYEVAHRAGVPTSKVYEVLARLTDRGLVLEVGEEKKRLYIPLDPEEMIRRQKLDLGGKLENLSAGFDQLRRGTSVSTLWTLRSREDFRQRVSQCLDAARDSVLLSVWDEDLPDLQPLVLKAAGRGVKIATVLFGSAREGLPGAVYLHPIRDTLQQERGGRGFVLVADSREVVWAHSGDQGLDAVWSVNPGFVTLAEDYVKHDIYIMKLVGRYGLDMLRRFGPGFGLLRDVFEDKENL